MKKVLGFLALLILMASRPAYSAYEDFSSYKDVNGFTFSKSIDKCEPPDIDLSFYTFVNDGHTTLISTSVTSYTTGFISKLTDQSMIKEGVAAFIWDKTGTSSTTLTSQSHFRTTTVPMNYDTWKTSNIAFWLYLPPSSTSPASVTMAEVILATDTAVTPVTYINTTQTTAYTTGWNYFKRPFFPAIYSAGNTSVSTTYITTYPTSSHVFSSIGTFTVTVTTAQMQRNFPDYTLYTITSVVTATGTHTSTTTAVHTSTITITNNITQSNFPNYTQFAQIKVGIWTNSATTAFTGIRADDIRFVDPSGWTGGIWNELGGVWKIFEETGGTTSTNFVYAQQGDCSTASADLSLAVAPSVLSKYGVSLLNDYVDFTYSAKVKFLEAGTPYGGIAFKYSGGNFYLFNINNSSGQCELWKYNGSWNSLAAGVATTALTGTYYYLKTVCRGSNIKAYKSADGITWGSAVFDITDASFASGKVGLFAGGPGTKTVYFDEVKVAPFPNGLTAVAKENVVDLAWTMVQGRTGEVTSYNIYRKESGGTYAVIGTSTTPAYSDAGAKGETTYTNPSNYTEKKYYYQVSANIADGLGESEFSNEASATPLPHRILSV